MIRLHRTALLAAVPFILAGCDGEGLEVVPEIDETFGFESGFGGWVGNTVVVTGGSTSVALSTEQASSGASSVRLVVDDLSGVGAARIIRLFELEPDRAYDVELVFDLGTADGSSVAPWSVVAGASPSGPDASGPPVVGSTATGDGFDFERLTAAFTATTGPEGRLVVALGVRQDTPGSRTYFLDEVQVVLTRR